MKIRYLLFCLSVFVAMQSVSFAQDDPTAPQKVKKTVYFGLSAGYNSVTHNADIKTFAYDVLCPSFKDGKAGGFHFGGFYEQMIGEVGTKHSIIARALYNSMPADFTQDGDALLSLVKTSTNQEVEVLSKTKNKNEIKYNTISLDLMYKFRALQFQGGALVLTVGPTFDMAMTKTRTQTLSLIEPNNVQFVEKTLPAGQRYSDDRRSIVVFDGDIEEASSIRFGVKAGVQAELVVPGLPFEVIPGVFYNFGFTDINNQDWKVNVLQIGVDFRYAFSFY
jgi:hypothetical protein